MRLSFKCPYCNTTGPKKRDNQRTCGSAECKEKHNKFLWFTSRRKAPVQRDKALCDRCGKEFEPRHHLHRYCSTACKKTPLTAPDGVCPYCHEQFVKQRSNSKTCGKPQCVAANSRAVKLTHEERKKRDSKAPSGVNRFATVEDAMDAGFFNRHYSILQRLGTNRQEIACAALPFKRGYTRASRGAM